jgi:hypothetical protein
MKLKRYRRLLLVLIDESRSRRAESGSEDYDRRCAVQKGKGD